MSTRLIDKLSTQNIAALGVVTVVTLAGAYQLYKEGKTDLLLLVSGAAFGWLFPKQK
jgi:hypothetical protein